MTIEMTSRGLAEINSSKAVYPGANMVNSGYSDCTLRITYQATMDSDNSVVFGDEGNPNDVVLTWKRSNTSYYDTLVDDAHVFTYGIELTKLFSDGQGNFDNVEFIVHNDIFEMRAAGFSLSKISEWLFENGILSPTGKERWSRETLNKMLRNEKYVGDVMLQKTFVDNLFDGKQIVNNGELDRILIQNHHQGIVDRELFAQVNGSK